MYYLTIIFCLFMVETSVFACKELLPADINQVKVVAQPPPNPSAGVVTGPAGITDFSHDNDDCTMDCRCTYNPSTSKWGVSVSKPGQACIYQNQCEHCKSGPDCTIRFVDLEDGTLYQATYHVSSTHVDIKECTQIQGKPVVCKQLDALPFYPGPGYFGAGK